jgi:hypothetical protein
LVTKRDAAKRKVFNPCWSDALVLVSGQNFPTTLSAFSERVIQGYIALSLEIPKHQTGCFDSASGCIKNGCASESQTNSTVGCISGCAHSAPSDSIG